MGIRAVIDHSALRRNLAVARAAAPASRIWAVIKADAYGHGMVECAVSLEADGFAVARLDEARRLRANGICKPILVMGGVESDRALLDAADLDCEVALHDENQARRAERCRPQTPLRVWLKVNTGMNRLGMPAQAAAQWLPRLEALPWIDAPIGLMTHLANADDPGDPFTELQCRRLREVPGAHGRPLNVGNSAGILGWEAARTDWVRPGIMLYGVSPFVNETAAARGRHPVMTLHAPLLAVNRCARGERVGYGGSYSCPQDMAVGVIGIGYGDGYPRHAPGVTPVLLRGRRVPVLGRVSMDTITVDLGDCSEAEIGDEATLWGKGLPVEEIAAAAGTIAYELLTAVTNRVPREHRR